MEKQIAIFEGKEIRRKIVYKKGKNAACRHDYKNAIKVGNIDYQCPLCGKILDPLEWVFMNSFEFIDA